MAKQIKHALVIGGGVAGPVTAMALQQAGIEATVHEAYQGDAVGVGAGLGLAPNGLAALDVIGAGDLVRALGDPMQSIVLQSWNGKRLAEFGSPGRLEPTRLVMRSDLYQALYDEALRRGIRIEHGKKLVGVDEQPGAVTAKFADGTTATGDLLIGADGIRSTVRGLIDPAAPSPRYAGLQGFGSMYAAAGVVPDTGGKMYMTFGKRAFFGLQVIDGQAVWFVNLPWAEPLSQPQAVARGAERWLAELATACAGDRTPAAELIRRTDPAHLMMTGPMESMPVVPHWSRDRLVLVGDSAHAPSSSSGQGASLAIESAVELAHCLRDLPLRQALARYEALRRPRVERIIKAAERTNSNKAAGPVGRVLRDALMPIGMRLISPEKMAWQFEHRIDWASPAAA
ncbi:FAD-dependent oxidoreductase [Kitasatospora viridis]|uniref:2-polyprenyl-6-methoxyphenol hydroxylase-like FAD-dependent oxidoreductase n=1 Tax=Kitasatospora viridis TaxID=281105 RepID=A0A561UP50_9ACTN|nr:NAD(P)/FAD-dependent oxidoreductase [Kitasatospora viridis]TWG01145.1 2-polyprenyl-6-methoxyphenol hydroxylase-like FAD-dependent oxidoreductase [Kitasatospora viridis]